MTIKQEKRKPIASFSSRTKKTRTKSEVPEGLGMSQKSKKMAPVPVFDLSKVNDDLDMHSIFPEFKTERQKPVTKQVNDLDAKIE